MYAITGGSSGIGSALAHALADRGEEILIIGRRKDLLKKVSKYSKNIHILCADITNETDRVLILNTLKDKNLKALVHNAGIVEPIAPLRELTYATWQKIIATNVEPAIFLTQKLLPFLLKNKGRVLHISSKAAYLALDKLASYCVSKSALSMLNRCWQLECPDVFFSSVMPGIVDTPMQEKLQQNFWYYAKLKQNKELLDPKIVARFLTWLLLDISGERFAAEEWDIYDASHQREWLTDLTIQAPKT